MTASLSALWQQFQIAQKRQDTAAVDAVLSQLSSDSLPTDPEASHTIGLMFSMAGRSKAALPFLEQAHRQSPNTPKYLINLAVTLKAVGQMEQALRYYHTAHQLAPDDPNLNYNLGNAYRQLNQPHRALDFFQRAIAINPKHIDAHNNGGLVYLALNDLERAMIEFQRAIELSPDYHNAHFNLGMGYLLQGKFSEGWSEYEWRVENPKNALPKYRYSQPRWRAESLPDKTLMLYTEQGYGDAIQFIRYLPEVKARVSRLILKTRPALIPLFEACPEVDSCVPLESEVTDFDAYASVVSLPHLFQTTEETIPKVFPYVSVDPKKTADWRTYFLPFRAQGKRLIAFVWSGSPTHENDKNRSTTLAAFAELFGVNDTAWFSLQVGDKTQALAPYASETVVDLSGRLQDFSDTAAALSELDAVVSVDTAVVHLAGALGKPTFVLLPFAPDWRWQLNRSDTPWYPSMRLLRQRYFKQDYAETLAQAFPLGVQF